MLVFGAGIYKMIALMATGRTLIKSSLVWVYAVCLGHFGRHLVFEILEHLCFAEKVAVLSHEKCHNQLEHPRDRFLDISLCHCFPVFHSEF